MFDRAARHASSAGPAGGAGGTTSYAALQGADAAWAKAKAQKAGKPQGPPPNFVQEVQTPLSQSVQYDVIMCGGTLGIFLACSLQLKGLKVAVVERGPLQGRQQEWNISRKELQELVHEGLLSTDEVDECISIEFNPVRAGFHGSQEVWTRDVLNLGVKPDMLIAKMRHKFEAAGGKVFERTVAQGVRVHPNGVALQLQADQHDVTGQLLIDCMGNFSPIVRQVRWGHKPDGVCMVVGSCCRGFDDNTTGDVIYTNDPIQPASSVMPDLQCFWEAFPSGSGATDRTTYMFTYVDAQPTRPSLLAMMEEYWKLMPKYQGIDLDHIEPLRILFGWFPTYRDSPLKTPFDRVLQIGDASGIQSPLSFGGFGAMARHLSRLQRAVLEAIQAKALDQEALATINAYNPGLSAAWMFQRAMSVRPNHSSNPNFINRLLGVNFRSMHTRGDWVLKPFMQDVVQFVPLTMTLLGQLTTDPLVIPQIFKHIGILPVLGWVRHFLALAVYTIVSKVRGLAHYWPPKATSRKQFLKNRRVDSWKYGCGLDYSQ
ncbi:TPA: hypothetical protein ACH3X3_007098 [Trebouxia sp. C0006]